MVHVFNKSSEELLREYSVSATAGLSSEAAAQRLKEYGYNEIVSGRKKSFLVMFLSQFKSFMIIILLIAAAISGVVGIMEGEGFFDTLIILGILVAVSYTHLTLPTNREV